MAHGDTKCPHVHVIVNRVNPEHGKAAKLSGSRLKLSKWAEGYERRQGRIRCQHRVWNNEKRARGERVRREPRLPRSRWQRERRHSVQVPRAKTPAGLSLAERSEWKNQERGARDSWIGHQRKMNLRGLSTRAGEEWGELYDRHRQEKAAEKQAGTTVWRRIRRWREKGSRLVQLRATLTRDSQLWRDWRAEIKARHKQERAALGQTHSRVARKIEQRAARGYQVRHERSRRLREGRGAAAGVGGSGAGQMGAGPPRTRPGPGSGAGARSWAQPLRDICPIPATPQAEPGHRPGAYT